MVLQRFDGRIKLHIRNYVLDEEEYCLIPTKKGVVIDKQQCRDLLNVLKDLGKVIGLVSDFPYRSKRRQFWNVSSQPHN